jgi:hypothetical protein
MLDGKAGACPSEAPFSRDLPLFLTIIFDEKLINFDIFLKD